MSIRKWSKQSCCHYSLKFEYCDNYYEYMITKEEIVVEKKQSENPVGCSDTDNDNLRAQ